MWNLKTFLHSHILKNHIHTYNSWIPHYFMIDISQNISRIKLFQMTRKTSQYFNMKLFYTFKALKPPSSLVVDFVGDEKRPSLTTSALQVVDLPYPLEYSPTLEYNLTPFQKSCFWAFSWIDPHFLVKKSPFCGIFWIEPHPKTHIEKYNPVVILERIRYLHRLLH